MSADVDVALVKVTVAQAMTATSFGSFPGKTALRGADTFVRSAVHTAAPTVRKQDPGGIHTVSPYSRSQREK